MVKHGNIVKAAKAEKIRRETGRETIKSITPKERAANAKKAQKAWAKINAERAAGAKSARAKRAAAPVKKRIKKED